MRLRNLVFSLVFVSLLAFGSIRFYYYLTDDFRLGHITYDLSQLPDWPFTSSSQEQQEVKAILNQPFYYLGKGAQSYAFVSQDGEYVLKFFKFKHLRPKWFLPLLPSIGPFDRYKRSLLAKQKRKVHSLFAGYALAYQENRDQSQLLHVHLMSTQNAYPIATIFDKMGREWQINLDEVPFLIQRKGEDLSTRIAHQLDQGQIQEAKISLQKILDMYMVEYQRGLFDRDPFVMQNTGFIQDEPFHLDVGKLTKEIRIKDRDVYKNDLKIVMWKISDWIAKHYPQVYDTFTLYLSEQYQERIGETLDFHLLNPQELKKRQIHPIPLA